MKNELEYQSYNIDALSFDRLLSVSEILKNSTFYGDFCCMNEVNVHTDTYLFKFPVRIKAFIFVVCSEGLVEISYDSYHIMLSSNSMFVYVPEAILQMKVLEKSRLNIMVFTRGLVDEFGLKMDNIPLLYKLVKEKHIFRMSAETCDEVGMIMNYTSAFIGKDRTNPYYTETIKSLFKSFIYRALYEIKELHSVSTDGVLSIQDNVHFDGFIRLLEANYKKHRSIKFYAENMNLTPKYLSLLIKNLSGKLATEWIDEYVILEAKNLIKYSSLSIQEISYALNFPNQSFFGKYFKRHTGMSPKAYRQLP